MKQLGFCLLLAAASPIALALTHGTTELGQAYVSGAITPDEVDAIKDVKAQYSLAVLTIAKGSGAYLSDVHLTIIDAHRQTVLDTVMDGPWLLVNLPSGGYTVSAAMESTTLQRKVAVGAADHHQLVFSFDTHDEVERSP